MRWGHKDPEWGATKVEYKFAWFPIFQGRVGYWLERVEITYSYLGFTGRWVRVWVKSGRGEK